MSSVAAKQVPLPQTGYDLYRLGTTLDLKFKAHESTEYKDLAATVIKRFEPFTCAAVLLVQRHSDNEQVILKLADRRLGYRSNIKDVDTVPWTSCIDDHLRRAVRDIQAGSIPDWFEFISDFDNRPDFEHWEDWMWEVSTWYGKMGSYKKELAAYQLLHRLQGRYIPRLFGVVRLRITPESTPLHPITDVVLGLVFEYIPGVSMDKLRPGVDVSEQEAERISSAVMEGLRAIEAENCLLHRDIHTRNVVVREGNRSAVIIDFGGASIRKAGTSDEDWRMNVHGGPDTRYMRRLLVDPENGRWKRNVTPYEMSDWHYAKPLAFNEYVESVPEDFRRATFERVLDTDWPGAREKVYQWRIRPGVRCRHGYDYD
ncbi:uncharacterized protein BT62DRAFT_937118 [Guyanagaster necrorhizus]|uniref:Protein kinase domain-containing protein n=1 Tax=Guyanagaster necrorhizus TaxID=856835 RepID=A0A9P7VHX3_9AGAR|nr:uncharacterized protein BT62DRAFT_937118 [Guyanagaster necrorhizus MCA 3950]KAG7441358.1 hypothetical protein BT62DRAFT_937118 [Guyanagaster necrorhizus MCA 3950]